MVQRSSSSYSLKDAKVKIIVDCHIQELEQKELGRSRRWEYRDLLFSVSCDNGHSHSQQPHDPPLPSVRWQVAQRRWKGTTPSAKKVVEFKTPDIEKQVEIGKPDVEKGMKAKSVAVEKTSKARAGGKEFGCVEGGHQECSQREGGAGPN